MTKRDAGTMVVIFVSQRTGADPGGYDAAAAQMDALAAAQPGYRGVDSVRDVAGLGITVSYWADAVTAAAWRDHPEHVAIREQGRAVWYDWYTVTVSETTRAYRWTRG